MILNFEKTLTDIHGKKVIIEPMMHLNIHGIGVPEPIEEISDIFVIEDIYRDVTDGIKCEEKEPVIVFKIFSKSHGCSYRLDKRFMDKINFVKR